jgi:predicted membrane protein (TIGR00267 family)
VPADRITDKKSELERKIRAREFVFGIQDGLISTVGLLSGVSVTQSRLTVIITGIAAAVTGALSMATGSYLASRTEKEIFEEGLDRPSAYRVVQLIGQRQDLLLRTVQEKVLGLGSADISQPVRAGLVMFLSFVVGAVIPLAPHLTVAGAGALYVSWALWVVTLLGVGVFKGVLTQRPLGRSGLEFAVVALGSATVGWLLGLVFDRFLV